MKSLLSISVVFLLLAGCSKKTQVISITSFDGLAILEEEAEYKRPCEVVENYAPDQYTETRLIRTNVHLMNDPEGNANFSLEEGKKYFGEILRNGNDRLRQNHKMNLPVGNDTPALNPSYKYKVVGTKEGDDGYYMHHDSVHYYFKNRGKNKNNYSKAVIEKYAIDLDSTLNIFAISHPQDSIGSKTYKTFGTGIALGNALKISGIYSNRKQPSWSWGTLMNHEIGHVLGLAHAWTRYDGCDDTPVHPNCWDDASCRDGKASNNVMDYNNSQMAFSPCQLGKIHKQFNLLDSRTRGLLQEDWCTPTVNSTIDIKGQLEWKGHRDLRKHIIIHPGARLDLYCRLSLARGKKIIVHEGGELHIHTDAWIHNSCGDTWKGIEVHTKSNIDKQLFIYGTPRMSDIEGVPPAATTP